MLSVRLQHVATCIVIHKVHRLLVIMTMTAQRIYETRSEKMSNIFKRVGRVSVMADREICTLGGQEGITLNTLTI